MTIHRNTRDSKSPTLETSVETRQIGAPPTKAPESIGTIFRGAGMGMAGSALDDGYPPAPQFSVGSDAIERQEFRHTDLKTEFLTESDWKTCITIPLEDAEAFKEWLVDEPGGYKYKDQKEELDKLKDHMVKVEGDDTKPKRELNLQKIFAEANYFIGLFENIARFDVSSHPNTTNLLYTGAWIAFDVAVYYKNRAGRTRPSVLMPELDPPIPVPAHAAFPSGHATQSYLVYLLLEQILERVVEAEGGKESKFYEKYQFVLNKAQGLESIAKSVGKNREYAGVHYESDTLAGQRLASQIFKLIYTQNTQKAKRKPYFSEMFEVLFEEAVAEWRRPIQSGYFGKIGDTK